MNKEGIALRDSIMSCNLCIGTSGLKETGLNYDFPKHRRKDTILLIAESPPVKGFFYDKSIEYSRFREKIYKLLRESGFGNISSLQEFDNKGFYLVDTINCRWDKKINYKLHESIFKNCSYFLAAHIRLLKPKAIITLGKIAKEALWYENVKTEIDQLNIPFKNILALEFPLGAGKFKLETDILRIEKLKRFKQNLK